MTIQGIHIIFTGGTIDKVYDASVEGNVMRGKSGVPDFLEKNIKPHFSYSHETLCMLDSNEITDEMRSDLARRIERAEPPNVFILHGTSTMVQTQNYLAEHLKDKSKTVILAGAMTPLSGFHPTDAGFNLGFALAGFGLLKAGVYIAMNSKFFAAGSVAKNVTDARYEDA